MPSDNPFPEPDDSDRTIIRPAPGGRRPARPAAPPVPAPSLAPVGETGPATEHVRIGISPLAAAAGPLLQLLSRLRNTVSQPDSGELRERTVREVRRFEQAARDVGIGLDQLRPAHYALCASLDDVVLATPWGSQGAWAARSLTSTFHQEVRSGERFFELLNRLRQTPGTFMPVIELMYLCLSLGFQGRYRLSPRGPAELDRVREETYAVISRQRSRPEPDLSVHWQGVDAPYRPLRAKLPLWVASVAGLALIGALFAWISFDLNTQSDTLFERMRQAPPSQMPTIVRATAVQPPVPAPIEPGELDKLRTFLKPEIDQGLVSVVGTDAVPVIRIRNRGLFASGSAVVDSRFTGLLERIGVALRDERGPVSVIGHTDNQPIRTVRFPSNYQLSAARAKAASDIIARTVGTPSRLSAEGRADADPIASNATIEGREENRRIEVILHRDT
jgi:type VI secretion system protein ImpK